MVKETKSKYEKEIKTMKLNFSADVETKMTIIGDYWIKE